MILITSAAYVTPGLSSEFGKLPPCMLPVQNRRLYEHQVALFKGRGNIVLSLPQSYALTQFDKRRLSELNVTTVFVPDAFSLGQSIVYVLNVIAQYSERLDILHGDTLFSTMPVESDLLAVANAEDGYDWASSGLNSANVYSGYFSFSNQSLLIRRITECGYRFIDGVRKYSEVNPMKNIEIPDWMDFGLVNTYYRSISKMTTQRVFNTMKVTRYGVLKSSKDKLKMKAEAHWIRSLPIPMRHYAPAVWDSGEEHDKGYYEIEYYYLSSLANLFVFGKNPPYVWEEIINACIEYLNEEITYKPANVKKYLLQNDRLYAIKTLKRLEEYSYQSGLSLDVPFRCNGQYLPSIRSVVEETDIYVSKQDERFVSLMHGDPCFSNILYDFKSKSVKLIDPRGIDLDGNLSIYGDFRYDVAKLAHSIIGMYDYIIGGMFEYSEHTLYDVELHFEVNEQLKQIQAYFLKQKVGGFTLNELSMYPILIHLFLSMLPLHSDNPTRQKAMLANALRLYSEFKTNNKV